MSASYFGPFRLSLSLEFFNLFLDLLNPLPDDSMIVHASVGAEHVLLTVSSLDWPLNDLVAPETATHVGLLGHWKVTK